MKQHVSPKQLQELPKEKIAKIFQHSSAPYFKRESYYKFHCKKMTIGKMIEIIMQYGLVVIEENQRGWQVYCLMDQRVEAYEKNKELCNALWEAVKYVLEVEE